MQTDTVVQQIRAFNRYYVDLIGLFNSGGYHSRYTLAETRVLFEIDEAAQIQASQVMLKIQIDKSYLSRIVRRLEKDGLIHRIRSPQDARAVMLSITEHGTIEMERINHASSDLVKIQIQKLDQNGCQQLVHHMGAIRALLRHVK